MTYKRLVFKGGPWDGHVQEVEVELPRVMEVRVPSPENGNGVLWRYEPGVSEGDVVNMDGGIVAELKL